eukprot:7719617-Pyramimonas_sp.AAC.3
MRVQRAHSGCAGAGLDTARYSVQDDLQGCFKAYGITVMTKLNGCKWFYHESVFTISESREAYTKPYMGIIRSTVSHLGLSGRASPCKG